EERHYGNEQWVLQHRFEKQRRKGCGKQPPQHAAERNPEIKLSEIFRIGPALCQPCVAKQRGTVEKQEVENDDDPIQPRRSNATRGDEGEYRKQDKWDQAGYPH